MCGAVYAWNLAGAWGGATRRRWCEFPGRGECCRPSVAMCRIATKSLLIWLRAYGSGSCFFGPWRSEVPFPLVTGGATRRAVRKHGAP